MFEGVQDQFHQFLAGATPPQIRASFPLSFSLLHGSISSSPFSTIFENYPSAPHLQPPTHHHHHHNQMMQQPLELQYPVQIKALGSSSVKQEGENTNGFLSKSLDLGHPWSQDEVLALFKVRSAMENWFPEFTWEHVSRKMEEIGFRRSPQKCKEKFEEESRYLHTITTNTSSTINADEVIGCPTKNISYRLFSELEELYHHSCEDQNDVVLNEENPQEEELQQKEDDDNRIGQERLLDENDGSEATDHHYHHHPITIDEMDEVEKETEKEKKKGKNSYHHHGEMNKSKEEKFKIFKSFCEDIVSKMMARQEELHNKILEDLIKRDKEKIAREEAWKKQEMERVNKEMEARAKDQAMAGDRQAKIIEFLKKFTSNINDSSMNINKNDEFNPPILCTTTNQNPSSSATHSTSLNCHIPTSSNDESLSQTSNSLTTHIDPIASTSNLALKSKKIKPNSQKPRPYKRPYDVSDNFDDTGKRWPREEVIALINIRFNLDSTNNTRPDIVHNESNKNPPLWERISNSMMELGYNRSAKRCKEKWENINKYFRKTKDSKKTRAVDSRTCPYFHQLSHLYSHGRSCGGSHGGSGGSGLSVVGGGGATLNVSDQGEVNGVHVRDSVCDF